MGVSGLCGCQFACRRWQIYKKPSVRRLSRGIFLLHTAVIMRIYAKNAKEYSFRIFRSCRSVVGVFPLRGGGGDGRGLPEMWCRVLCFPLLFASVDIRGRSCVPLLVFFRVSCCCIRCRPCVQIVQIVRCVQNLHPMYASKVLRRMAARMHRCVSVFVAVRDVAPTTSPYPLCRCYVWRLLFCSCVIFVRRCRLLWLQPPAGEKRGRERGAVLRPMNTSSLYLSATQTSLNKPNHPFCVLICVL